MRRYAIPAVAVLLVIGGVVFIMIPFIPLGWLLLILAALILVPYFKWCRKVFSFLVTKDRTGMLAKASRRVIALYKWAGDHKNAQQIEKILSETLEASGRPKEEVKPGADSSI